MNNGELVALILDEEKQVGYRVKCHAQGHRGTNHGDSAEHQIQTSRTRVRHSCLYYQGMIAVFLLPGSKVKNEMKAKLESTSSTCSRHATILVFSKHWNHPNSNQPKY